MEIKKKTFYLRAVHGVDRKFTNQKLLELGHQGVCMCFVAGEGGV